MEGEYSPEEVEQKWRKRWVDEGTFEYREEDSSEKVFSVDTPPPTISGDLHLGSAYGYILQDFMARFRRMQGYETFYPFGYDNNGIASERLTERELGIEHQNFSRREFQEKVREVCEKYEDNFRENMQRLGESMDWTRTYGTIDRRVQEISQLSFIDLYENDRQYREEAPTIWCPECETAISQVEMEDAERDSSFNDIEFPLASGQGSLVISTTRPELLPACVGIIVHPEDGEHGHLAGEKAEVPIFGHEVPIIEDDRVDLDKGSGVVMTCTFGDQTDIEWYKAYDLDLRIAIDESGTMTELAGEYEGLTTEEAREMIIEDLEEGGFLLDTEPIRHTVQVHERCDRDIEFRVTEQWYIKLLDRKHDYLDAGREIDWYPEKMFTRYEHWIEGLQWDWCISRQRDSGIPVPAWYCEECGQEVLASRDQLPVDPLEDEPPVENCPECSGDLEPDADVLDTWATSSLTPLINADWGWDLDQEEFRLGRPELYPMNLRPQGHDIISFWLFHTIVKCYEHTGEIPFEEVMINGMVLDENREKMSKSRGNYVSAGGALDEYSTDALRYWAARTRVGDDLPFKKQDIEAGEKLMRKLWNASKLVDSIGGRNEPDIDPDELEEIDRWMLAKVDLLTGDVTGMLEEYEFSKARNEIRNVFWHSFCDNYLEITKQRLEDGENLSARYTLYHAHRRFLKLFAPYLSHITEEIWQEMYGRDSDEWRSIHRTSWPEQTGIEANIEQGEKAMDAIAALRKYKSRHQMAPTDKIERARIHADISDYREAVKEAMHIRNLETTEDEPEVEKKIQEIKLNYEKAGPKYGEDIGNIEESLEENDWNIESGRLHVAGHMLKPEMFKVVESRKYTGEGEMIESGDVAVVIE